MARARWRVVTFVALAACEPPTTSVVVDNDFGAGGPIVYAAYWENASFATPVLPGAMSSPMTTVATSAETAYVVLAEGWDPSSPSAPTSYVLLQSPGGFSVALGDTLHIPVSDQTFDGDCASGSHLTQQQADFIVDYVFPSLFFGGHYDVGTCTMTLPPPADGGAD